MSRFKQQSFSSVRGFFKETLFKYWLQWEKHSSLPFPSSEAGANNCI